MDNCKKCYYGLNGKKNVTANELHQRKVHRKSVVAENNIKKPSPLY